MPTERQLDIILESELEFKTFKEEPMSNNKLPTETQERIKADAEAYALPMVWVNQNPKGEEQLFYEYISSTSYIAGATAEQQRAQVLVDALEAIEANSEHPGIKSFAAKALEQWKGTGKEETKPEPEGCPYCGSATCTSDHK